MSLKLNQEIWTYVERLYIHCYTVDDFKIFLKKFGIDYDNPVYITFKNQALPREDPLRLFMSEPNYDFAHFIQTIPTYKYLSILQQIVFDPKIILTRQDGWNYYGEPIRTGIKRLLRFLEPQA